MSNLLQRVITGVIGVSAIIFVLWLSPWGIFGFCLIVALAGLFEFYKITGLLKKPAAWLMLAGSLLFFILGMFGEELLPKVGPMLTAWGSFGKWAIWAAIIPLTALSILFDKKESDPLGTLSKLVFGWLYTVLTLWLLADLSLSANGSSFIPDYLPNGGAGFNAYYFQIPLGFMFMVWATDTFAYFGGKFLGKNKLFERISPKKTWEGAISGGLGCILLGVLFGILPAQLGAPSGVPGLSFFVPIAVIVSIFSQLGDLVESMFKRSLKIKDSGGILPGHGGILDRFDGFYLALPFVWLYALIYVHFLA